MVLQFQFRLLLAASKSYCVCDWTLEWGSSAGFSRSAWFSQGCPLQPRRSPCGAGWRVCHIVQPSAGDCIYFSFYVISAVFTCFFIVSGLPQSCSFRHCREGRGTLPYELLSTQAPRTFPLSAAQRAAPHGHWTRRGPEPLALCAAVPVLKQIKSFQSFLCVLTIAC